MPSVSSLLRSAEAARNKIKSYEDQVASYNWDISAKTPDDLNEYVQHLQNRATTSGDPSEVLSYQKKIVTARRSYISHEIQRESINVLEGRSSLTDKYNNMVGYYQAAIELGDLDLAQSLRLQLDNLDLRLQAQQEKSNSIARTMASARKTDLEDTFTFMSEAVWQTDERGNAVLDENGEKIPAAFETNDAVGNIVVLPTLGALKQIYADGGEEGINMVSEQIAQITGEGTGNFWDMAQTVIEELVKHNQYAADVVGANTSDGRRFLEYAQKIQNGETTFDIAPGLSKLSLTDVQDAVKAARAGQQLFIPTQRDGKNEFIKTKVTDYVWGLDENGNYEVIKTRSEFGDFEIDQKIKITNKDGETEYLDISDAKEKLKEYGFNVKEQDGRLVLGGTPMLDPILRNQLESLGISPNTSMDVVVGEDGNLRFLTPENRIVDIAFGDQAITLDEVLKDEYSSFGRADLGEFGKMTSAGIDFVKKITNQDFNASRLLQGQEFSTTGLLNQAQVDSERVKQAQLEIQRAQKVLQAQESGQYLENTIRGGALNTTTATGTQGLEVRPITLPTNNLRVTKTGLPQSVKVDNTLPQQNVKVTSQPTQKITGVTSGSGFTGKLTVR